MIRRLLDTLYDVAAWVAAAFVFMVFAVMVGGSAMRLMGMRTGGSDDIVAWCCAAAGFLAMAHTFRRGDFVRVTLLLERFHGARRRALEIASLTIAALFVAYLAWAACQFVYESWDFNDMANGLIAIPLWIPQSSFVVGALLLLFAVIDELVTVLRGGRPAYQVAIEERHARGDFSEDV
ncbi:MAG TPA: TRAP transporter small permease [Casimicrobiaceae bacterium]|nr:TRAP transporter small permease [Casimicrobiaceae bacterium]